jgi:hypothetical protein
MSLAIGVRTPTQIGPYSPPAPAEPGLGCAPTASTRLRLSRAGSPGAGREPAQAWTFEGLLRQLVDEKTYPLLHRIAWSSGVGGHTSGLSEREEFLCGLDFILDGVQARIRE